MTEKDTSSRETDLPTAGRALDVMHEAVRAMGKRPYRISYRFTERILDVQLYGSTSTDVGEALFARLGTVATLGKPWDGEYSGLRLAHMTGSMPGFGLKIELLVEVPKPSVSAPAGPVTAQVAQAETARAAQGRVRPQRPQRPGRTP